MKDKIENYLNIIHYCLYKAEYRLHFLFNKINPAWLLMKIPFIKRRYEKMGVTRQSINRDNNNLWGDKRFGLSTVAAGGFLWGGLGLFFFSVLMMLKVAISTVLIVGCALGAGLICYAFVFRQDKYIKYFDKYEKWSKQEKRKYGWLTVGSILFVLLSFYFCLVI
ncbi:hypothetical protein FAZ15_16300 [Sphingobacterium olei]|uniref:Uncharacterized protein n=1 Tax=Sphingobacterium olei TaxID=2571155 RepID=A0A4U0NHC6_9SPHI|nr:hypothetical protein [Sphingobacterium olei]TJZ53595.1 hypothetical protein FAZ15_16300 [Sphingobacterium olei]